MFSSMEEQGIEVFLSNEEVLLNQVLKRNAGPIFWCEKVSMLLQIHEPGLSPNQSVPNQMMSNQMHELLYGNHPHIFTV